MVSGSVSIKEAAAILGVDRSRVSRRITGKALWAFVTMGKPLGNGYPLAAVVTTREIADAFDTGMKYFNTFGGNPVSCAIGSTVLDIVIEDGLQQRAKDIGHYFHSNCSRCRTVMRSSATFGRRGCTSEWSSLPTV